jgi:hypothetical protein
MPEQYRGVLNKTHSGLLYPEEQGGGVMVEIEVFHQVHCLVRFHLHPLGLPLTIFPELSSKSHLCGLLLTTRKSSDRI